MVAEEGDSKRADARMALRASARLASLIPPALAEEPEASAE